jgi:tetratricopeptide (TPR) repeat protein
VCNATDESLESLSDKSLIRRDGERFTMLTIIREFALEQLTARDVRNLSRKHADHFLRRAESAKSPDASGPDPETLAELGREYENLRTALEWLHDNSRSELFLRLVGALGEYYWSVRGPHAEARRWLETALDVRAPDSRLRMRVLVGLGAIYLQQGDYDRTKAAREEALELAREVGDREVEASSLGNLGAVELHLGDYARARALLTQSEQLARDLGKEITLAGLANVLGVLELLDGRLAEAERWLVESLAVSERIGNREGATVTLLNLGLVAFRGERLEEAASRFREGLQLADELQHPLQTASCTVGLAAVATRVGDLVQAGRLLDDAETILEESGSELEPVLSDLERETREAVRASAQHAKKVGPGGNRP